VALPALWDSSTRGVTLLGLPPLLHELWHLPSFPWLGRVATGVLRAGQAAHAARRRRGSGVLGGRGRRGAGPSAGLASRRGTGGRAAAAAQLDRRPVPAISGSSPVGRGRRREPPAALTTGSSRAPHPASRGVSGASWRFSASNAQSVGATSKVAVRCCPKRTDSGLPSTIRARVGPNGERVVIPSL
jgi:hypothetical protein